MKKQYKRTGLQNNEIYEFREFIYGFYLKYGRDFPWRKTCSKYEILVSELMLQQTQTQRVAKKYPEFLESFPSFIALANSGLSDVIKLWQGLGYNRRAKFLQQAAKKVVQEFDGRLPEMKDDLLSLPGIGEYTANALRVFCFQKPELVIETNIRRVFIHHFYPEDVQVHDKEILPLIEQTKDYKDPKNWYYALMDYGAFLKSTVTNPNRKSAHYTKQKRFEGSDRQIRGAILRYLSQHSQGNAADIAGAVDIEERRIIYNLENLKKEMMVAENPEGYFSLPK
ncbi:MAG: A/G-specific adenine glycosylase [Spirochaetia bacterium]